MIISVVGNGFDIRHGLPTKFQDFLEYYSDEGETPNLVYDYLIKVNLINGWLDFEQEIQSFLIYLSRFINTISTVEHEEFVIIDYNKFVESPKTLTFYNVIRNRDYPFFRFHGQTRSMRIYDEGWVSHLVGIVLNDIENLKKYLNLYLKSVNRKYFNEIELLDTSFRDNNYKQIRCNNYI